MLSFQSRNYAPMTPLGDDFDKKHKSFRLKSAKTQDTSWLFTVVGRHCPVMRVICSMRCGQYRSHFHQSVQWCQSKNKGRKLQEKAIRPLITKKRIISRHFILHGISSKPLTVFLITWLWYFLKTFWIYRTFLNLLTMFWLLSEIFDMLNFLIS